MQFFPLCFFDFPANCSPPPPPQHTQNSLTFHFCLLQARASGDYHPGNWQWAIGLSSLFVHAVGMRPSKDCWWSTSNQTWKDAGVDTETKNRLQSLVAILSTGEMANLRYKANEKNFSMKYLF
jgi:hypothetical protein